MILTILICVLTALPQERRLSGEEVLKNLERTFESIQDLAVKIEGTVSMEGVKVPKTSTEMYFKRPDKLHFSSRSFTVVPRDGMSPNPEELRKKYDATNLGEDTTWGRKLIKLQLAARDPKVRLRQMFVWVNPTTWTLARIESMPYEGRTVALDFTYGLIEGRYWLPTQLVVIFGISGPQSEEIFKLPDGAPNPAPQMTELQRALRSGSVSFVYRDHKVNAGIPDSVFVRKGN
ncbi:MAG: hypothetical protein A2X67_02590 [Ignavibacteria bacterium GWA2_55_11]|nr:MAG: hypothetical protein A2X67_02590 [Ignavibacteria bacterium GWA2_55_11]OGU73986.1 MAG: hypothetical protein A3H45_15155 [Ignavibacteria bacterium RIFCSPLOWO2_02_FULL_55_14]